MKSARAIVVNLIGEERVKELEAYGVTFVFQDKYIQTLTELVTEKIEAERKVREIEAVVKKVISF